MSELIFRPEPRICPSCGREFLVGGRENKARPTRFCSRVCRGKARFRSGRKAKDLSATDAAYIAGFVDGEGCIMAHMNRDVVAIRLQIVNTKRGVLDWIREVTGVGNVYELNVPIATHATRYDWTTNAEAAGSVLKQIRPYLRIKGAHADLALEVLSRLATPEFKADRSWHRPSRDRMRAMNAKGPAIKLEA